MSKKSLRNGRGQSEDKSQPAILRRKRKAESDLEVSYKSESHCEKKAMKRHADCEEPQGQSEMYELGAYENFSAPVTFSQFRGISNISIVHPTLSRESPLPRLAWAEEKDVWLSMTKKEMCYPRDQRMLIRHPDIQDRMRSILLDWLIEVCEVYTLHRECFYLAQDFVDRYLLKKCNVPKQQLQLLGVTALFIASKIEEIYPPKLSEFAYVTDGACTEQEILDKELVILMTLNWNLTPVTVNTWLNIFLQIAVHQENEGEFEEQRYSAHMFVQLCQVLDLCMLDIESLKYPYSILAAAVLVHLVSKEVALSASGFKWIDVAPCVSFMGPFVDVAYENGGAELKNFKNVCPLDRHNIQTHNIGLKLLDQVQFKQAEKSPSDKDLGVLTPPLSDKKLKRVSSCQKD